MEKHVHTYVCTYIMIFEGVGAGQRYKQHSNVSRKGTAAPISQSGTLRLWRPGCIAFRVGSGARVESPKPHSSFHRVVFVAARGSCRARYRSGLRRGLHPKRGAAPPAGLLSPAGERSRADHRTEVPPLAAWGLSASAGAWAWFDVRFAPLVSAFHPRGAEGWSGRPA